ncbi:ferritin-like metal-binding protein YciE [Bradyrhizobium sp. S3.2.12]
MADRQTLPRASPGTAIPVVVIVFPAIFAPMYAIRSDIIYLPRAGCSWEGLTGCNVRDDDRAAGARVLRARILYRTGFSEYPEHVAPYVYGRPSQQDGEASGLVFIGVLVEQRKTSRVPLPSLREEKSIMGIFTKDIKTMDDLLIHGLQDIYYAEQQITKALPKMIDKATNRDLVTGLKNHLEETNKQIERLQKVFEKLGREPSGAQCPAIDGIIREADETAGEIEDKAVLDAAIVANAQAVEHYEICRYGTLIAWAEELGHDEIVRFLTTNLNEEKAANTKLNTVALRKGVNAKASSSSAA